ncbi:SlyX family protein [Candidatus Bathyarchaeota archaeon]|nr:SlyX family protein [Candidatus Bathyarchaeota archaeon]
MIINKHSKTTVLTIFLLSAMLLLIIPTHSSSTMTYDTWADINDDGKIDVKDIAYVSRLFGTAGDNLNKTELLYNASSTLREYLLKIDELNSSVIDLQHKVDNLNYTNLMPFIDDLNASLLELQSDVSNLNTTVSQLQSDNTGLHGSLNQLRSDVTIINSTLSSRIDLLEARVSSLETRVATIEAAITQLQASDAIQQLEIDSLNSSLTSLSERVSAIEANYSYAIPLVVTSSTAEITTTGTGFVSMPGMSVTINPNRTSTLLILLSVEAYTDDPAERIWIRAMDGGNTASPGDICLTPTLSWWNGDLQSLRYCAYSYVFFRSSVGAGTHTINILWRIEALGKTGYARNRTLTVITLPA